MMFFSPATHSLSLTLCALCNLPNKHKYFFNSYFIHECKRFLHALYNVYTHFFIASCSTSLCLFCKHKETQILSRSKKKIKFEFNKGYEMNLSFLMLRCFFPRSHHCVMISVWLCLALDVHILLRISFFLCSWLALIHFSQWMAACTLVCCTHTQPQSSMHCSFSVRWHPAHNFTGNHYRSKCILYSPQSFCVGRLFIKLLGRNFSGQVNRDRIVNQLEHEYLKKCMAEPNGLKWSVSVFELCKSALDQ